MTPSGSSPVEIVEPGPCPAHGVLGDVREAGPAALQHCESQRSQRAAGQRPRRRDAAVAQHPVGQDDVVPSSPGRCLPAQHARAQALAVQRHGGAGPRRQPRHGPRVRTTAHASGSQQRIDVGAALRCSRAHPASPRAPGRSCSQGTSVTRRRRRRTARPTGRARAPCRCRAQRRRPVLWGAAARTTTLTSGTGSSEVTGAPPRSRSSAPERPAAGRAWPGGCPRGAAGRRRAPRRGSRTSSRPRR